MYYLVIRVEIPAINYSIKRNKIFVICGRCRKVYVIEDEGLVERVQSGHGFIDLAPCKYCGTINYIYK